MIRNITKKSTLIKKSIVCRSPLTQGTGFMWHFKRPNHALVFAFKHAWKVDITMFCVFVPLDILFLDKNKRVVEIKKDLRPWGYYHPKNEAMYVVELPTGLLRKTAIGDRIEISNP